MKVAPIYYEASVPSTRPKAQAKLHSRLLSQSIGHPEWQHHVRGAPYGSENWTTQIAAALGLNYILRPRGRPLKSGGIGRYAIVNKVCVTFTPPHLTPPWKILRELQCRRFPEKWLMAKGDAHKIYKVETESGNRVLRARSEKQRIRIVLEHAFEPLAATPILWRMSTINY